MDIIDEHSWRDDLKRRVQHYGYRYDYTARRVTRDSYLGPLPDWLRSLAARLRGDGLFAAEPDQVIVNEYLPGQGIAPHVDCEPCFGDIIASLSLGSACVMQFDSVSSGARLSKQIERRSLLVLQGEARFDWKHGIPARKTDVVDGLNFPRERRVSLTFRNVVRTDWADITNT
ncbi:MAG: alpha-ketoglutarate-dependent dioxygenase AlkB [Devosia sp.]